MTETKETLHLSHAGVIAPPPAIFGAALLAGLVLQRLWPLRLPGGAAVRATGIVLVVAGLALSILVMRAVIDG